MLSLKRLKFCESTLVDDQFYYKIQGKILKKIFQSEARQNSLIQGLKYAKEHDKSNTKLNINT